MSPNKKDFTSINPALAYMGQRESEETASEQERKRKNAHIHFLCTEQMKNDLQSIAARSGVSMNAIINIALREYIDKH